MTSSYQQYRNPNDIKVELIEWTLIFSFRQKGCFKGFMLIQQQLMKRNQKYVFFSQNGQQICMMFCSNSHYIYMYIYGKFSESATNRYIVCTINTTRLHFYIHLNHKRTVELNFWNFVKTNMNTRAFSWFYMWSFNPKSQQKMPLIASVFKRESV